MKRLLCAALLMGAAASSAATETLLTKSFEVRIDVRCPGGSVSCDDVHYTATNRRTGKSISVAGRSLHTTCADGVTPCRFLGYVFTKGTTRYTVWEDGTLEVTQRGKSVLGEKGEWQ